MLQLRSQRRIAAKRLPAELTRCAHGADVLPRRQRAGAQQRCRTPHRCSQPPPSPPRLRTPRPSAPTPLRLSPVPILYCRSGDFSVETGKLVLRTVTQNERTKFLKYIIRLVHQFSECGPCRPGVLTSARLDFEHGICTPYTKRFGVLGRAPRSVGLLISQRGGAGRPAQSTSA